MISKSHTRHIFLPRFARMAVLLLAALTLCAALSVRPVQAAEWMQPYLEQVQEWGVMRGDGKGNLNEDRTITRAEFVTLVNRAFGYTEVGPSPFTDVKPNDWYAEDISIAHQAGYFNGTSANTASPLSPVTREQAAVLLGRCLRLQGTTGVSANTFSDVYDIGGWSRGMIQEAADLGIIQGYADGTFRPNQPITRGQMACFLVRALGTLIQEPGEQSSGGVYGNLTITVPGVKLKDTTITGNLYLTGGVGLGNLELENVTVLGKIVVCGSGEAEHGQNSIVLRNVTAGGLEVDSLMDQFLSIRAEGLTSIDNTVVRTSAYLEDLTEDGLGLKSIQLNGAEGTLFQLAGNIKEVLNLTPRSTLQLAQGVAGVVTMDEKAVGASLTIDVDSYIKELNLDTATPVTGAGSITHLNVNAPGSNVSMLPDTIYVRPGITGNVNRTNMDNKTAAESSEDPRLLAGYPAARNIAPTSAEAVFRTNKAGTIRWALTALMDGSVGEEELMNPSAYPKILRNGTINATASNTDFIARLTGLTKEGSYYISAMLVDARNRRSPVKVAAFTTPDDTAPNFATGYPQAPILTTDANGEQVAQIMVMPTKDCQLYYVLLPKGSIAPTAADFRTGALPGNLGYGVVSVRKNTPFLISRINTSHLQEKTDYDLYLWLNDADNGKSSAVKKVTITTKDITPPNIISLYVKSYTATTVTLAFSLDEPGTLSWAAVTQGASIRVNKTNPSKADQITIEGVTVDGKTVIRKGGPVRAAQGGTEYTFTVSGLQAETSYDLYYTAKDTAGNYCVYNESIEFPLPIRTQDGNAPKVEMWFNRPDPDNDTPTLRYTMLNGDVGLQFSEIIMGYQTVIGGGDDDLVDFHALYERVATSSGDAKVQAKNALATALREHIKFYTGTPSGSIEPSDDRRVTEITSANEGQKDSLPAWIDYREAVVVREDGKTRITFPSGTGIKLQSGSRYFFRVEFIEDTAPTPNKLPAANVSAFATVSARVDITENENIEYMTENGESRELTIFRLSPKNTEFSPESARWDLILWAHSDIEYNLYVRRIGGEWYRLTADRTLRAMTDGSRVYHSLFGNLNNRMIMSQLFGMEPNAGRPRLMDFTEDLEFAILSVEGGQDGNVTMEAEIYTGTDTQLRAITINGQGKDDVFSKIDPLERVSNPKAYKFIVRSELSPVVRLELGTINPGDSSVTFSVNLNLSGRVYCLAVPVTSFSSNTNYVVGGSLYPRETQNGSLYDLSAIPQGLVTETEADEVRLPVPDPSLISHPAASLPTAVGRTNSGNTLMNGGGTTELTIRNLQASTVYILYLVSADTNDNPAETVLCYRFETTPPNPPVIDITPGGTSAGIQFKDVEGEPLSSNMSWVLVRSDYFTSQSGSVFNYYIRDHLADGMTLPSRYANYTILDAMLNTGSSASGLSVFDIYADGDFKDTIAEIIRSTYNDIFRVNQERYWFDAQTPNSSYTSTNLTFNLTDSNDYTLLVVARGTNSETDGFRASRTYRMAQSKYLQVIPVLTPDNPEASSFTGTIYLTFNDNLRYRLQNTDNATLAQIDTCQLGHTKHAFDNEDHIAEDNGCVNLFSFASLGSGVTLKNPTENSNPNSHGAILTRNLELELKGVRNGSLVFNFTDRITGATTSVRPNAPALMATLARDSDGNWDLNFTYPNWLTDNR